LTRIDAGIQQRKQIAIVAALRQPKCTIRSTRGVLTALNTSHSLLTGRRSIASHVEALALQSTAVIIVVVSVVGAAVVVSVVGAAVVVSVVGAAVVVSVVGAVVVVSVVVVAHVHRGHRRVEDTGMAIALNRVIKYLLRRPIQRSTALTHTARVAVATSIK